MEARSPILKRLVFLMMAVMFIVNASIVPAYAQTTTTASPAPAESTTTTASPASAETTTGASISGVVRDSNGGPLQNATVSLQGPHAVECDGLFRPPGRRAECRHEPPRHQ
jgi:hypothetical protein